MTENRRFPRIAHVTSRQIVRLDDSQTPQKNIILTRNLSASGVRFMTHENLPNNTYFLIYLNNLVLQEMGNNHETFLKSGDYFLAKVVWTRGIRPGSFEIGAAFLEKQSCRTKEIDTFTELVNVSMLDLLPEEIGAL